MARQKKMKGALGIYWQTGSEGFDWVFQARGQVVLLKNGDYLFIFDKQNLKKILWEGMIRLHPHVIENATTIIGQCTHADQEGVECGVWDKFFRECYPAKLVPKPTSTSK